MKNFCNTISTIAIARKAARKVARLNLPAVALRNLRRLESLLVLPRAAVLQSLRRPENLLALPRAAAPRALLARLRAARAVLLVRRFLANANCSRPMSFMSVKRLSGATFRMITLWKKPDLNGIWVTKQILKSVMATLVEPACRKSACRIRLQAMSLARL